MHTKHHPGIDVAEELLFHLQSPEYALSRKAKKIIKKAQSIQDIFENIITLCSETSHPKAYFIMGKAYNQMGSQFASQALSSFQRYLESRPEIPNNTVERSDMLLYTYETFMEMGYAYEAQNDFQKAISCYKKAQKIRGLQPRTPPIMKGYGKKGEANTAMDLLKKLKQPSHFNVQKRGNK